MSRAHIIFPRFSPDSSSSEEEDGRPKTALDALVKLFLERYEASQRLELEQQEDGAGDDGNREAEPATGKDAAATEEDGAGEGMKWRLIEDKQLERQRRGRHRPLQLLGETGVAREAVDFV